jgi:hypothetical protein
MLRSKFVLPVGQGMKFPRWLPEIHETEEEPYHVIFLLSMDNNLCFNV